MITRFKSQCGILALWLQMCFFADKHFTLSGQNLKWFAGDCDCEPKGGEKMPSGHPQNQKRRRRIRDTSEVSCCLKYVIFGFNVIFWVSIQHFRQVTPSNSYGVIAASRPRSLGYWNLGLDWEGYLQQPVQVDKHCPGPSLYLHLGRCHNLCNWWVPKPI